MRTVEGIRRCMAERQYAPRPILSKTKLDHMCKVSAKWYASWRITYTDGGISHLWGGAGDTPDAALLSAYERADWFINGGENRHIELGPQENEF